MRFGVLVSGRGSNLQALLDAAAAGDLAPAEIAVVVSNRPGARALDRARAAGVPAEVVDHKAHDSREAFEAAMQRVLDANGAEAIVLAGFMRILTPRFVDRFAGRMINTHPSLLPAFPGIKAPQQAIDHGVKIAGCTVHFVDSGVDTGAIIAQAAVEVLPGDTAASLHARIQAEEHRLLPNAARDLAAGRLVCEGRRVGLKLSDAD